MVSTLKDRGEDKEKKNNLVSIETKNERWYFPACMVSQTNRINLGPKHTHTIEGESVRCVRFNHAFSLDEKSQKPKFIILINLI